MSVPFWIWSHLSFVLLTASVTNRVLNRHNRRSMTFSVVVVCSLLAVTPISGLDLSGYVLGHIGVLSVPMVVLLLTNLLANNESVSFRGIDRKTQRLIGVVWAVSGVLLYASAFGWIDADFYALGFRSQLPWFVMAASMGMAAFRCWLPAICLVVSVNAWHVQLCESTNLWDYLIDPWMFLMVVGQLLAALIPRSSGATFSEALVR